MDLQLISFETVFNKVRNTPYARILNLLNNHRDKTLFYEPISDKLLKELAHIELALGHRLPDDYLNFLRMFNGGKIFDISFIPVTHKENEAGLFYLNFKSSLKTKYKIPKEQIIIAFSDDFLVGFELNKEALAVYHIYDKKNGQVLLSLDQFIHIIYYEISFHLYGD